MHPDMLRSVNGWIYNYLIVYHYAKRSAGSLKYKGAVYLISNMTGHFSYVGYLGEAIDTMYWCNCAQEKRYD
jgi:hypothetical protein